MVVECSSSLARRLALGAAGAALALLGGCVVAPMEPYELGAPVVYSSATVLAPYGGSVYYGVPAYTYGPGYYAPGYYYGPYWRPSVSIGIWGGSGGRHWHGHRRPGGQHWSGRRPGGANFGAAGGSIGSRIQGAVPRR